MKQDNLTIFVVGTGRSGTHWLGYTLDCHPDIVTTVEESKVFPRVTAAAMDPRREARELPAILRFYRRQQRRAKPRHYADKSHPNLWLADHLVRAFGDSVRFVGIERSPFGVAASSLVHGGVRAWHAGWREMPIPNRFLGIDETLAATYDDLSEVEQFAHRWLAHRDEMRRLRARYPEQSMVLTYERLIDAFPEAVKRIWDFLGVRHVAVEMDVKSDSRDRWRSGASPAQVAAIASVTGVDP